MALFLLLAVVMLLAGAHGSSAQMRRETLKIITDSGEHTFQVEMAESDDAKARGLMFRRSLADDAGMLFPYLPPQEATMWMRNTYISLDMVFIAADGSVHRVEEHTEPFSERTIASNGDVAAVLELKAGIARKIKLKRGDRIVHAMFPVKKSK